MMPVIVQTAMHRLRRMRFPKVTLPYPQDQQGEASHNQHRKDRTSSIVVSIFFLAIAVGLVFLMTS